MIVEARDLFKIYHQMEKPVHAINGISLQIKSSDYLGVAGPSGCGKSTLLHVLGALDAPSQGEVLWHGESVYAKSEAQRTRLRLQKIGFVFQRFYLLPMLTAQENIELPMRELRVDAEERRRRSEELLESVGLSDRRHHRPAQLSGGEMQRIAIARALSNRP
ncbi:MAG TPA: ATP-binding cassette domain-containing protein, partial [Acidobacteriota bacterium]|nr:ATP-binding cassette domain-containing protein [Acidobacteriota bacterium]